MSTVPSKTCFWWTKPNPDSFTSVVPERREFSHGAWAIFSVHILFSVQVSIFYLQTFLKLNKLYFLNHCPSIYSLQTLLALFRITSNSSPMRLFFCGQFCKKILVNFQEYDYFEESNYITRSVISMMHYLHIKRYPTNWGKNISVKLA